MEKLHILVVDDHWIARAAIGSLVPLLGRETELLEADSPGQAMTILTVYDDVDLIILDLNLPGAVPWDMIADIRKLKPSTPVLIMSVSEDRESVLECLKLGVSGYLPKTASPEHILATIRRVLDGEVALPHRLLVNAEPATPDALKADSSFSRAQASLDLLTPRQREIFALVGQNKTNAEISAALGVSINTVRAHMQSLSSRLDIRNRAEIASIAARLRQQSGIQAA